MTHEQIDREMDEAIRLDDYDESGTLLSDDEYWCTKCGHRPRFRFPDGKIGKLCSTCGLDALFAFTYGEVGRR